MEASAIGGAGGSRPAAGTVPFDYWSARLATLKAKVDAAARRPTPIAGSCVPGPAVVHTSPSLTGCVGAQAAQAEPWHCTSFSSHLASFATVIPPQPPPDAPFTFTEVPTSAGGPMPVYTQFSPAIVGMQGLASHTSSTAAIPALADFRRAPAADGWFHDAAQHAAKHQWAPRIGGLVDANLEAFVAVGKPAGIKRQRSTAAHTPSAALAINAALAEQRTLPMPYAARGDLPRSSSANLLMSLASAQHAAGQKRAANERATGQCGTMHAERQTQRGAECGYSAPSACRGADGSGLASDGACRSNARSSAISSSSASGNGQRVSWQSDQLNHGNHARASALAAAGPYPAAAGPYPTAAGPYPAAAGPYPVELPTISSSPSTPMNGAMAPYPVDRCSPMLDVLPPAIVMSRTISGMSALDGDIGDVRGILGSMSTSRMASLFDATPEAVEAVEAAAEVSGMLSGMPGVSGMLSGMPGVSGMLSGMPGVSGMLSPP